MTKNNIVIIGGGYVGLSLALALEKLDVDVKLIEKSNRVVSLNETPCKLLAISKSSEQFFESIDIDIKAIGQQISYIRVMEDSSILDFEPNDIGYDDFGYMVDENKLMSELLKLRSPDIYSDFSIENGILNAGDFSIKPNLIVGCDGKKSKIRDLFNIKYSTYDYMQHGIVCEVSHEFDHEGGAIEMFTKQGPFAILPKMERFKSSIVWTCNNDILKAFSELEDKESVILKKFGNYLGKANVCSPIKNYPLELVQSEKYFAIDGELTAVLAGDSAHAIHPLAGQGLNLGLKDIEVLASLIKKYHELGLPINSKVLLEEYEKDRKLGNKVMISGTHYLNTLFGYEFYPIKIARKLGLSVVEELPILKNMFMKYAIGKFGNN